MKNHGLDHDPEAELLSRYIGDRFVMFSRHNYNEFESYEEEVANYIENGKTIVSTAWYQAAYVYE